jgi:hypothetical protein
MLPSEYEVEWMAKELVRERLREAEQDRLVRAVLGPARRPERWQSVMKAVRGALRMPASLSAEEPRRRSPSAGPTVSCDRCGQGVCEA